MKNKYERYKENKYLNLSIYVISIVLVIYIILFYYLFSLQNTINDCKETNINNSYYYTNYIYNDKYGKTTKKEINNQINLNKKGFWINY